MTERDITKVDLTDIIPLPRFIAMAEETKLSTRNQIQWWVRPDNRAKNGIDDALLDVSGRIFVVLPWFKEWLLDHRMSNKNAA